MSLNAQQDFRTALKDFSDAKTTEYGSHAYSAGYAESLAVDLFSYLSKKQQKLFLESMQNTAKSVTRQPA